MLLTVPFQSWATISMPKLPKSRHQVHFWRGPCRWTGAPANILSSAKSKALHSKGFVSFSFCFFRAANAAKWLLNGRQSRPTIIWRQGFVFKTLQGISSVKRSKVLRGGGDSPPAIHRCSFPVCEGMWKIEKFLRQFFFEITVLKRVKPFCSKNLKINYYRRFKSEIF